MKRLNEDVLINFNAAKTHMIGYDLGAHYLHMVAFEISALAFGGFLNADAKVQRLTALDPAGLFQFGPFLFAFFQVKAVIKGTAM